MMCMVSQLSGFSTSQLPFSPISELCFCHLVVEAETWKLPLLMLSQPLPPVSRSVHLPLTSPQLPSFQPRPLVSPVGAPAAASELRRDSGSCLLSFLHSTVGVTFGKGMGLCHIRPPLRKFRWLFVAFRIKLKTSLTWSGPCHSGLISRPPPSLCSSHSLTVHHMCQTLLFQNLPAHLPVIPSVFSFPSPMGYVWLLPLIHLCDSFQGEENRTVIHLLSDSV